jgi:hypothetical protein
MPITTALIFLLAAVVLALSVLISLRRQGGQLSTAARIRLRVAGIFLLVSVALFFLVP